MYLSFSENFTDEGFNTCVVVIEQDLVKYKYKMAIQGPLLLTWFYFITSMDK